MKLYEHSEMQEGATTGGQGIGKWSCFNRQQGAGYLQNPIGRGQIQKKLWTTPQIGVLLQPTPWRFLKVAFRLLFGRQREGRHRSPREAEEFSCKQTSLTGCNSCGCRSQDPKNQRGAVGHPMAVVFVNGVLDAHHGVQKGFLINVTMCV